MAINRIFGFLSSALTEDTSKTCHIIQANVRILIARTVVNTSGKTIIYHHITPHPGSEKFRGD